MVLSEGKLCSTPPGNNVYNISRCFWFVRTRGKVLLAFSGEPRMLLNILQWPGQPPWQQSITWPKMSIVLRPRNLAVDSALLLSILLLLLKSFQSCPTLCDPIAAHQAPLSLGFSRQEHWSGLPFPSPMHESEKRKWSRSVVSNS